MAQNNKNNNERKNEHENEELIVEETTITQEELEKLIDERVENALKAAEEKRQRDLENFAKKFNEDHENSDSSDNGKMSKGKKLAIGGAIAVAVVATVVIIAKAFGGSDDSDYEDDDFNVIESATDFIDETTGE